MTLGIFQSIEKKPYRGAMITIDCKIFNLYLSLVLTTCVRKIVEKTFDSRMNIAT